MANSTSDFTNKFKVSLRRAINYPNSSTEELLSAEKTSRVVFDVTPDITETRSVTYKDMSPVHMPGTIYVYGNTSARTFSIDNIKLISRTVDEATKNLQTTWTLRSWTMPHFGRSSTLDINNKRARVDYANANLQQQETMSKQKNFTKKYGQELLGLPPAVLYLNAYSSPGNLNTNNNARLHITNLNKIPVVITSLTIPFPSDVDYIPTIDGEPFPRVMLISIQLNETQAPRDMERFSLQQFRTGQLVGF